MTRVFPLDEIQAVIDPAEVVDAVARGFAAYTQGRVVVPPVGLMHFDDPPGDVHIKYGYVAGDPYYVVKTATGFYDNPKRGLPTGDGTMLVGDARTGAILAVLLDRGWLTELRTGAAGAVAARHLAPPAVRRIGVVGAGMQARFQVRALAGVTACRDLLVWSRTRERLDAYRAEMSAEGWRVETTLDLAAIASTCNLIVTVTPAERALLHAYEIRPGTHITAVGSDSLGKQELDPAVPATADVVAADSISQATHHGECAHAVAAGMLDRSDIVEIGAIVAGDAPGRTGDDQITVADLTGVAVQDIAVATMAYRALARR